MPSRNLETELEETEKVALVARQREEHSRLVPPGLCPWPPLKGSEESYSVWGTGHGQLLDILLIGGWWGPWESASSTFWFQLVWGLYDFGQHTDDLFHLVGPLAPAKQLQGHGSEYIYSFWGRAEGPWLCWRLIYYYSVLLDCFPFSIFSLLWLNWFFD